MAVVTTAVAAGVAAAGSLASAAQARKSAKASGKAAKARAKIAKLENARARRDQIRQERIEQGTVLARAATQGGGGGFGTLGSSGVSGVAQGLRTQLRSNLAFIDEASRLNQIASKQEVRAIEAQGKAALFAGISSAASSVGSLFAPGGFFDDT